MIKSILASLTGYGSDRVVLDTSVALAKSFDSRIECLHVQLDAVTAAALSRNSAMWDFERIEGARRTRARHEFETACKQQGLPSDDAATNAAGFSLRWRSVEGVDRSETAHYGQLNDLVVIARDPELSIERLGGIVMKAGRPVVVAAARPLEAIGRTVGVSWKPGPESARALTASMPILAKAQKVLLLAVREDSSPDKQKKDLEELAGHLSLHGINAEPMALDVSTSGISNTIRQAAYNAGADLLIMGAYGHSRLQEFVFGGVTRDMLIECALPVLMFH